MTAPLQYLSVCSGVEAASVAWHPLGWNPVAFSEIDRAAAAVLKYRFPHVPNMGDMTKFREWPDLAIDLLVGGTPCQAFSIAGLRQGLADPRGNLMLTYLAIADRYRPEWLLWENVPGVLSSNGGRDFGALIGGLVELGYGVAWRVLDAQYVRVDGLGRAVPQRRRRVFVVGHLGSWSRAAAVLFDGQSLRWDSAPRRKAGESTAHDVAQSLTHSGRGVERAGDTRGQDPIVAIQANSGDVGYCLTASAQQSLDAETETLLAVAHTLRAEGFDASEDGTGRGTPIVPVAGTICRDSFSGGAGGRPEGAASGHFLPVAIQERAVSENPDAGPQGAGFKQDGTAYTLEARHHVQAVAFAENERGEVRLCDVPGALSTGGGKPGQGFPATLIGHNSGWAVRRLTPRECERLQGFPDDWTRIPTRHYREKRVTALRPEDMWEPAEGGGWWLMAADGPRYKQMGNSMAVNVMRWIGRRIEMVRHQP